MSQEIVKSSWLSEDEKKIVRSQFFTPTATPAEMIYCMKVAENFNLNPILKQIFFVPRKAQVNGQWVEKIEPLVGRDSFLTLAHRSGKFAGIDTTVEMGKAYIRKNGGWDMIDDLNATCRVYRTDVKEPFVVQVSYNEYVQKTKDGTPTKFWNEKPETMLKKVAESQALRKAFDITGLNSLDERNDIFVEVEEPRQATQIPKKQEDAFGYDRVTDEVLEANFEDI